MNTLFVRVRTTLPLVIGILVLAGCASPSGGALTLKQTRLDVGWKMEAYQEAITFGNATENQKRQVSMAYKAYQTAFRQALAGANGNMAAPSPANVQQLANQLIATVDGVLSTLTRSERFPGRTPPRFLSAAGV